MRHFIHRPLILPFYHLVSNESLPHIKHLYPVKSVDQFKRELDFLQANYNNISLETLIYHQQTQKPFSKPCFHLTFDDGLKECSTIIAPILKERGLDATFFINPNFIGDTDIFYRYKASLLIDQLGDNKTHLNLLKASIHDVEQLNSLGKEQGIDFAKQKIYLNEKEIEHLIHLGFTIGAHSMNHPYYSDISTEEQIHETNDSIRFIQERFNISYRVFSFPFTDTGVHINTFKSMNSDLSFGTAGIKDDSISTHLQRLPMDNCLSNPSVFVQKHLLKFAVQSLLNKHRVQH